jgi:ATP-dependent exoDNAse (exonuclease V) alpha subunit
MNGDLGTVQGIKDETLTIQMDAGRSIDVDCREYPHLRLGYALTAHKAQGATLESAFVLAAEGQEREISYVEASRASGETRWFLPCPFDAAVIAMEKSNEKLLATELLESSPELDLTLTR